MTIWSYIYSSTLSSCIVINKYRFCNIQFSLCTDSTTRWIIWSVICSVINEFTAFNWNVSTCVTAYSSLTYKVVVEFGIFNCQSFSTIYVYYTKDRLIIGYVVTLKGSIDNGYVIIVTTLSNNSTYGVVSK